MGPGAKKQFREVRGEPLLARTLRALLSTGKIDTLTLAVPAGEMALVESEILPRGEAIDAQAVVGGADRQESVARGLLALGGCAPGDIVLVHDGVRPFVTAAVLDEVIEAAREVGAATCGVPAKDTIKLVAPCAQGLSVIERTIERGRCYLTQTPQAFQYAILKEAHERWEREMPGERATDDAMMVERLGRPVAMTRGLYENLKITTPEDFLLAEAIAARWE